MVHIIHIFGLCKLEHDLFHASLERTLERTLRLNARHRARLLIGAVLARFVYTRDGPVRLRLTGILP